MTTRVGDYLLFETLGTGAFGKVKSAVNEKTGATYAVKIMNKTVIRNCELAVNVRREIAIMKALKHPNVVTLHHVLTSPTKLYLVLDLVEGGELFEHIVRRAPRGFPEPEARRYFQHLIDGLHYCHSRGVCHRDLKPENLLLDCHGTLKITDFGLSSMKGTHTATELLTTLCGTPNYIAPEIITRASEGYNGYKIDAWACGIILFALLAGHLPFHEEDVGRLFDLIQIGHVDFPPYISVAARDLIHRLLAVDPIIRTSVADVKTHPWFLVDYVPQPPPPTPTTNPRRGKHHRTSRSTDSPDSVAAAAAANTHLSARRDRKERKERRAHRRPKRPRKGRRHADTSATPSQPRVPTPLSLDIPPSGAGPLTVHRTTSVISQDAARAATDELSRQQRGLSFSRNGSILRRGVVNYGAIELSTALAHRPTATLGGKQEARLRGVLSVNSASTVSIGSARASNAAPLSVGSVATPLSIGSNAPLSIGSNTPLSIGSNAPLSDTAPLSISSTRLTEDHNDSDDGLDEAAPKCEEQKQTIQAIRSLQTMIAVSKSGRLHDDSVEKKRDPCRSSFQSRLHDVTLAALRRLRPQLQELMEDSTDLSDRARSPVSKSSCALHMSLTQRHDMLRLLDVWETRMMNERARSECWTESTAVGEEEMLAFQSLLRTWETQLAGEGYRVEEILIPGSVHVDEERPTEDVPEQFLRQKEVLQSMEWRRKPTDEPRAIPEMPKQSTGYSALSYRRDTGAAAYHAGVLLDSSIPGRRGSHLNIGQSFLKDHGVLELDVGIGSVSEVEHDDSANRQDLNLKWDHVLVANTSNLDDEESSNPADKSPHQKQNDELIDFCSPITNETSKTPASDRGSDKTIANSDQEQRQAELSLPGALSGFTAPPPPPPLPLPVVSNSSAKKVVPPFPKSAPTRCNVHPSVDPPHTPTAPRRQSPRRLEYEPSQNARAVAQRDERSAPPRSPIHIQASDRLSRDETQRPSGPPPRSPARIQVPERNRVEVRRAREEASRQKGAPPRSPVRIQAPERSAPWRSGDAGPRSPSAQRDGDSRKGPRKGADVRVVGRRTIRLPNGPEEELREMMTSSASPTAPTGCKARARTDLREGSAEGTGVTRSSDRSKGRSSRIRSEVIDDPAASAAPTAAASAAEKRKARRRSKQVDEKTGERGPRRGLHYSTEAAAEKRSMRHPSRHMTEEKVEKRGAKLSKQILEESGANRPRAPKGVPEEKREVRRSARFRRGGENDENRSRRSQRLRKSEDSLGGYGTPRTSRDRRSDASSRYSSDSYFQDDALTERSDVTMERRGFFGRDYVKACFESGYGARSCMRELGSMMAGEGYKVDSKRGATKLRVFLGSDGCSTPASFEFVQFVQGRRGCEVRFECPRTRRSGQTDMQVEAFYRRVVAAFNCKRPGYAVLDRKG